MNSAATSPETKRLLTAAWVAPMDRRLFRDGGVVFDYGTIVAVGSAKSLRASHPDARVIDLGAAVILPGLVNAHTHLELSDQQAGMPPESFVAWLLQRIASTPSLDDEGKVRRATEQGVDASIRSGVTCVGDISRLIGYTRPVIHDSPLRATSYCEVTAMATRRPRLEPSLMSALACEAFGRHPQRGLSPHAPYSIEIPGYKRCLKVARQNGLPITTHLAESPDEARFLSHHEGPFRELWDRIGAWDDDVPTFEGGPIRMAQSIGLLDYPKTSLAHVNYCDDDELSILARGKASVVYCPRTHRYFGHPPHRWREMLARGINVAVGTDSCASSPDLNLVDDLRLLHEIVPEVPAAQLWHMATTRAARAIAMDDVVGSLTVGKAADFTVFDAVTDDPVAEILEGNATPREVWISGEFTPSPRYPGERC